MKFERRRGIQGKDTHKDPTFKKIVEDYLLCQRWTDGRSNPDFKIIDPFARNCVWAEPYTNDINPDTKALDHLDALDYLRSIDRIGERFCGAIYDPPFSDRQNKEIYGESNLYTNPAKIKKIERELGNLIEHGGYIVKAGYNTNFSHDAFELVHVAHLYYGGSINDTIISVWLKTCSLEEWI
mgnify:CR=1 FL=1|tara:strand:- start:110 stop:655 length:546 start_codon:yes stop_codon:yes gene_type:complete